MEKLSHFSISCFKHWISDKILCRNTSVIIRDWWYNTSRHPAVQCCWSLQASPYFLTSSTPLSLSSSFMRSLQPSPSYQCLIHFPSNSLRALWFICLWSLLTLSNTFPFFPLFSVFLSSLLAEPLGAARNINYFSLFDHSLSLPLTAPL